MSDTAPCPPSPIADNPSALPSPTPSLLQSVALLACSLHTSPWMPAVVLYYSTVRLKCLFYFLFVMYYLCEKYYKLIIVQDYVANCVSWVLRLTLSDSTNKLHFWTSSQSGLTRIRGLSVAVFRAVGGMGEGMIAKGFRIYIWADKNVCEVTVVMGAHFLEYTKNH